MLASTNTIQAAIQRSEQRIRAILHGASVEPYHSVLEATDAEWGVIERLRKVLDGAPREI